MKPSSVLITDAASCYPQLKGEYEHEVVNHSVDEFVRGRFHTNSIEGFFSHLKRGINGTYHHVSSKHLQKYCNEFAFRYNTRKLTEIDRFDTALRQSRGRMRYRDLIRNPNKPTSLNRW